MSLRALISDATVPVAVSLAGALRAQESEVAILSRLDGASPLDIPWNRPSALSARTAILTAKNRFGVLDAGVVVFDSAAIPTDCLDGSPGGWCRFSDEYVRGYLLLAAEMSAALADARRGTLCFTLVERSVEVSGARPTERIGRAVAEAAFVQLAEETARSVLGSGVSPLLVRFNPSEESEGLPWLAAAVADSTSVRKDVRWVKSGSRGIFGRL